MKIVKSKDNFELEINPDELKLVLEIITSNKEAYNLFLQYAFTKLMINEMPPPSSPFTSPPSPSPFTSPPFPKIT